MRRKWFFDRRLIVAIVLVAILSAVSVVAAASPALQAADCSVIELGSIDPMDSKEIPFTCSIDQQVYFGVCDVEYSWEPLQIQYLGVPLASNSYPGESQVSHLGKAGAVAGVNVATLFNLEDYGKFGPTGANIAPYAVAISPSFDEVANYLNNQCDVPIESLYAPFENFLFEHTFTGVNAGDDPLVLKGIISDLFGEIIFRAKWEGSSGTLTVIRPGGTQVTEGDPGVNHNQTETSDEIIISNPEKGEYTIIFDPVEGFVRENVTLGAYVTGAPFLEGENLGSVRGTVFLDDNDNGELDAGEKGIEGVSVAVASGAWQATFVSGDDGTYAPVALGRGYYSAEVTVPAGYVATTPTRYEGIPIGFTGRTALFVDFGLSTTATPTALPASGFGPGTVQGLVIFASLLAVVGFALLWRTRVSLSRD